MLRSLHIKNYALIDELVAEFPRGLVVITGETGAGKSIIIESLNLLLGERASAADVRKGSAKAIVEGMFPVEHHPAMKALLHQHDIDWNNELILRREVSAQGQSRCFVNDSPVTLSVLKSIGDLLVDLHGQHEHQALLRKEVHISMLDEYGGLTGDADEYRKSFQDLSSAMVNCKTLVNRAKALLEKRDLYEFQLREIDEMNPRVGEEDSLEQECKVLENAEKLFEATGRLRALSTSGEQSIRNLLHSLRSELVNLASIDPAFSEAVHEASSATAIVDELGKLLHAYHERITFDPQRLEELRNRLVQLGRLKRKYGGTLDAVLEHRKGIAGEIAASETIDQEIVNLGNEIERIRAVCVKLAARLSASRKKAAAKLEKNIVDELRTLGIPDAQFQVSQTTVIVDSRDDANETPPLNQDGLDTVEFFLSTNRGEEPQSLVRVASGGEVSRVMLALKNALAGVSFVPVMVFDEIDVGVSGRIAQQVGRSLKAISNDHQVIVITHLPQIAGLGDAHFVVSKQEVGGRTRTTMTRLSLEERIREVAKLMSGDSITSAGLTGAKELMGLSKQ